MSYVIRLLNNLKPRLRTIVFAQVFFLTLHCGAAEGGVSLCNKGEVAIFSCPLSNNKAVAICSGIENKKNFTEYRYGTPLSLELRFRADPLNAQRKFHRAEVLYASNAAEMIWFGNNGVFYRIHMLMRGGPFLDVVRDGKTVSRHDCQGGWGGVENAPITGNEAFVDHGSGDDGEIAPLWGGK